MNNASSLPGVGATEAAQLGGTVAVARIIGESPVFVSVLKQIPAAAKFDVSVLILGETGTGKEIFARAIHSHSQRSGKPFVAVNCGAIPAELVENEFFGHEPGAFTSALARHRGLLKEADGGTIFLDEVDSLPVQAQVKLLRFIQDGEFRPLGSEKACGANLRVIAACNIDLYKAVVGGRFRADLYYRLNVAALTLPPLREREEDIVLLARHFVAKYQDKFGAGALEFSPAALHKLYCYHWPGNVRELENVVQRALIHAHDGIIQPTDIRTGANGDELGELSFRALKTRAVNQFEQAYLRRALLAHSGNITHAARAAGKHRRAFWELMRKHGIDPRTLPTQEALAP